MPKRWDSRIPFLGILVLYTQTKETRMSQGLPAFAQCPALLWSQCHYLLGTSSRPENRNSFLFHAVLLKSLKLPALKMPDSRWSTFLFLRQNVIFPTHFPLHPKPPAFNAFFAHPWGPKKTELENFKQGSSSECVKIYFLNATGKN